VYASEVSFDSRSQNVPCLVNSDAFLQSSQCPLSIWVDAHSSTGTASYTSATLDTGGWLGLTRQGLAPCKKRQASLGALTPRISGKQPRRQETTRSATEHARRGCVSVCKPLLAAKNHSYVTDFTLVIDCSCLSFYLFAFAPPAHQLAFMYTPVFFVPPPLIR
jgi:hypothetical protein